MINSIKLYLAIIYISLISVNCHAAAKYVLPADVKQVLAQLQKKSQNLTNGHNADYIPELAKVNPALFGIAIVTAEGQMVSIGDADIPFAMESISKPFAYALALNDNGEKLLVDKVGLNATGHSFNSISAIERMPQHLQNPFVNAGAIQVTSLIKGQGSAEKWQRLLTFIQQLTYSKPYLGKMVYQSETNTNLRNEAIAKLLDSYGMMQGNAKDALDRYTKACSIMITAKQLAMMGATLANHGISPISKQRIISSQIVQDVLSQMVVNGLYQTSGEWFWSVGIPTKSGVGGGFLAVVPNKMAIAVFSPPLDQTGNSIRGQYVVKELAKRWKLHVFAAD